MGEKEGTIAYSKFGSREESEVVGFFVFSHKRIMGYFRLNRWNTKF